MKHVPMAPSAYGLFFIGAISAVDAAPMQVTVAALQADPESFAHVVRHASGHVTFLGATVENPLPVTTPAATVEGRARGFIQTHRGLFISDGVPLELAATQIEDAGAAGISHVRLQQLLLGVPVRGASADVHLTGDGVTAVSSALISPSFMPDSVPVISSGSALDAARAAILAKHGPVSVQLSEARLEFFDPTLGGAQGNPPLLAWYVEGIGDAVREQVWVDAATGTVAKIQNRLTEARNRRTFDANNTATIPATPTRTESQAATGITDVDRAHDFAGDFYSYFLGEHGRDSFNGTGATIDSVVRFCPASSTCPYRNAFWNGLRVTYGAGFAVDDVVAHELTHAVIDYTAILFYENESGALNESYADVFGETIDLGNGKGNDAANQRWIVGEDLPGITGGIRSLGAPGNFGDPARVKDANYYCGTADNGGVHTNSGVPNRAFALMTDGGTYNGYTVSGIGLTKAAKIQYRAMSRYLKEFSTFLDNFTALIQSCSDLIGSNGITFSDCAQVKKAVLAVEMSTKPCTTAVPPAAPPAAPAPLAANGSQCPAGQSPTILFQDDFENINSGRWSTAALSGSNHWIGGAGVPAIYSSSGAAGGTYSLRATPGPTAGHSYVVMANAVTLPPSAILQFDGKHDFEPGIDGGVVEYSTNAGATWIDASGLFKSGRGYTAGLVNGVNNPLGGRVAFSGNAAQYATTRVDLSTLSGRGIQFRLRTGTDSSVAAPGWWIDNVAIYTCATQAAGITVTPISGLQTGETQTNATFTVVLISTPSSNVTINLSSSDVSEGTVAPSAVTFTPTNWSIPQTVTVTGVDDAIDDDNVSYTVVTAPAISADASYNGFNAADVGATNADNDTAGIFYSRTTGFNTSEAGNASSMQVTLNSAPTATVTLTFTSSDPSEGTVEPASVSFNAGDWNVAKTVTLTGVNDDAVDGSVPYTVSTAVASADAKYAAIVPPVLSAVNTDNDTPAINVSPNGGLVTSENGGTATFTIRLATQPSANVTIGLRSSDSTEGSVSPSSLTLTPANWSQGANITVTGVDDDIADGNTLYRVITDQAVSTDSNYSPIDPVDVTVTNSDNESPNIVVNPTEGLSTTESGGTATFTIALTTQPTADVVIALSSRDTTEGTVSPSSVTLTPANWNQPAVVTLTGVDDPDADGDRQYAIEFGASVSTDLSYNGRKPIALVIKNVDNETVSNAQPTRPVPRVVVSNTTGLRTSEDGGAATFTVRLSKRPLADVTIRLTTSDSAEGRVDARQLVFTPDNGDQSQNVTVVGRDDGDSDGDVKYSVILSAPSTTDPEFAALGKLEIDVVNADNDKKKTATGAWDPIAALAFLALLGAVRTRRGCRYGI